MHLRCVYKMHPDDLKAIWICHECRTVFIFYSDVDDHNDLTGHRLIEKVMISSLAEGGNKGTTLMRVRWD
jgi:hypothetical protein